MTTNDNAGQSPATESNVNIANILGAGFNPTPETPTPTPQEGNSNTDKSVTDNNQPPVIDPNLVSPPQVTTTTIESDIDPESYEGIVKVLNSNTDSPLKADIFNLFKASSSDDKGNLLNAEGKIVLSAERFKDFVENDNLPLNEKGEAINELGEVIKSKEQIESEVAVIVPVKSAIETNFGIKLPEEAQFTDDTTGLINLIQESVKQLHVGSIKNYLESNPEIKGFAQHLALGGTIENYTASNINYKDINIKELSETSKIEFLKRSFSLQGNPNSDTLIDLIAKAGEEEINKQTASALVYLDNKQKENNKLRDEQLKQQQQQEELETKNYWTNVEKIVQSGNLHAINIPIKERQAFFDYIAKPINNKGESAEYKDMENDTPEFDLMVSYLRYKKGNLSQLVQNLAETNRVKSLSDRIKKHSNVINGSGVPSTNNTTTGKISNLNITTLLGGNNSNQ